MRSVIRPWSLCVTFGLLTRSQAPEEEGGGHEGICHFIWQELIKVSEQTCFDQLPKFLCCHEPPSIGCFKDQTHRDLCCDAPFSPKVLAQEYLIGLVLQQKDTLQRYCPFAPALTQLVPYQIEDLKLPMRTLLNHELEWLARAMSFAGASWSNLLLNHWPVFGVLRRVRDIRTPTLGQSVEIYYQQLETTSKALHVGQAFAHLNRTDDCMAGVTARLHLALMADAKADANFLTSPMAQLVDDAELQAVRCQRKLLPRLRRLITDPAPVLTLLHEIWRKLRPTGWKHLAEQAEARDPTSLTVNACLCELEWEMQLSEESSFRCIDSWGCCDPYGTGDFFCKTQPGCYQAYDSCFPRKAQIGGAGLAHLVEEQTDFLKHKWKGTRPSDDLTKCQQIATAIEGKSEKTQVLDVGAGTAPCKPIIRSLGYAYTAQDAKEYAGTEGIAGSVFLHGYADIDVVSDIANMPLANNSFDVVICTDVLEHVLRPREAVHEIGRLLKAGGMAFIQVPFGGALHNLPHHYYAGFTHLWFEKIAAEVNLETAWGYHFETLGKRIQRSLQSEECLSGLFGGSAAVAWRHHVTVDLPNVLEHLRSCQSSPEGAVDQAFPSGIRAVLIKTENL